MKTYEVTTKMLITKRYRVKAESEPEATMAIAEPFVYYEGDEEVVCVKETNENPNGTI